MKVLLVGANGFIGSHLCKRLFQEGHHVHAMDIKDHNIKDLEKHIVFSKVDICTQDADVEAGVNEADMVLPFAAIATPALYLETPIAVMELGFMANFKIIQWCVKHKKRILFPSTSEVYGMNTDKPCVEDASNLQVGPTQKHRWIYSCCKQLLERVLWAYGPSVDFTIVRLFNWFGPRLDSIELADLGRARVTTQFIVDSLRGRPMRLVDGGMQRRCFTWIQDGIDCMIKIIDNPAAANGQIFNIGDPGNDLSMKELADRIGGESAAINSEEHYGKGYQDMKSRVPDITKAKEALGWTPTTSFDFGLKETIAYYRELING